MKEQGKPLKRWLLFCAESEGVRLNYLGAFTGLIQDFRQARQNLTTASLSIWLAFNNGETIFNNMLQAEIRSGGQFWHHRSLRNLGTERRNDQLLRGSRESARRSRHCQIHALIKLR